MPTVLPFHRAVVVDPAFAPEAGEPFRVHTRWIETEFDNTIEPWSPATADLADLAGGDASVRPATTLTVEVDGKRLQVRLPGEFAVPATGSGPTPGGLRAAPKRTRGRTAAGGASGNALTCPMQGTIVRVAVTDGDTVAAGDLVVVLEAMKMEQPLTAHKAGVVKGLAVSVGQTLGHGVTICEIT